MEGVKPVQFVAQQSGLMLTELCELEHCLEQQYVVHIDAPALE